MSSPTGERPYTVVVGVDGSWTSRDALRWAVGEARARHGALKVIHAFIGLQDYESFVRPDEHGMRDAAQQRLDASLAGIDTSGIDIDASLVEGDPRHALVDAARDAELLVVGSHGRGQLAEAMLGSVSSFCVHHGSAR